MLVFTGVCCDGCLNSVCTTLHPKDIKTQNTSHQHTFNRIENLKSFGNKKKTLIVPERKRHTQNIATISKKHNYNSHNTSQPLANNSA